MWEWNGTGNERSGLLDPARLTPREKEVAHLVSKGFSNKQIAAELGLAYSTIKNHVSGVLDKLDLEHRTQLALYVHANWSK